MKFAQELDDNAVPEWKSKYLDYKSGKKKLKAVAKAIREFDSRSPQSARTKANRQNPFASFRDVGNEQQNAMSSLYHPRSRSEASSPQRINQQQQDADASSRARPIPVNERSPLRATTSPRLTRYGSIIGSPPKDELSFAKRLRASTLKLPEAALDPGRPKDEQGRKPADDSEYDRPISPGEDSPSLPPPETQMHHTGDAYKVSKPKDDPPSAMSAPRYKSIFAPVMTKRANSNPESRPVAKRMFSFAAGLHTPQAGRDAGDIALEAYIELDFRQAEFFVFLDKELAKIEAFYLEKEDEHQERLKVLRSQLHIMRERRLKDVQDADEQKHRQLSNVAAGPDRVGKTSRAMEQLGTPTFPGSTAQQDYVRRQHGEVPYHVAKRKLKVALQESYRGLELLKSYVLLNRTAFRKINKKYCKTVANVGDADRSNVTHQSFHGDYMEEKVNKAHFVQSDIVDNTIRDIEDLYARYFERGNRKLAVGKLRAKTAKASDYGGPMFRTGALLSIGLVFGIQGLVYGALEYYRSADPVFQTLTSFLLQIYGGYFLLVLLSGYFVYDSWTFDSHHVNYPFIFELDTRNNLNWRQLAELPSVFACVLGVTMWLNFSKVGGMTMFIYWPVILIGVSTILLFCPVPQMFYFKSRRWFLTSIFRLLLSGLYPVEFRDFFLGDMLCSQTYAMGNIEIFFCLYASHWNNPPACNSSHSRLLGFFSALPGIWRALQCARRYRDTWNWYPHLANMGKYGFTILQYMTLSLWRLNESSNHLKALFITVACINSLYCSVWDIFNDWSLSPPALREILAYEKHRWWYYFAMIADPILRFLWLGYVIFPHDYQVQHSSLISFMIAFLEVVRRGIWVIFRVENEHCTNVARYRATKQTELPYQDLLPPEEVAASDLPAEAHPAVSAQTTSSQIEAQAQPQSGASSVRRRPGLTQDSPMAQALKRAGSTVLTAHAQDYERRRPTAVKEGDSDEEDSEKED